MRLIDADALIEKCGEWYTEEGSEEGFIGTLKQLLEKQPTIDPQRMRGKWVKENVVLTSNPPQYQWHCSECGQEIHGFYDAVLSNFCPSCGADMRGEQG